MTTTDNQPLFERTFCSKHGWSIYYKYEKYTDGYMCMHCHRETIDQALMDAIHHVSEASESLKRYRAKLYENFAPWRNKPAKEEIPQCEKSLTNLESNTPLNQS